MDKYEFLALITKDKPTLTFTNKEDGKKAVIEVVEVGTKDEEGNFQHALVEIKRNGESVKIYYDDLYSDWYNIYSDNEKYEVSVE
ncbi:MAG: hypothetical protein KAT32_01610 [Candidatus Moranbacteria bacterium]|nr:hypothetical protein [Candidatus Moranbacteria bacterium]